VSGGCQLYGETGSDTLVGGTENDRLDGGAGIDMMSGGSGDDVYYVDNLLDSITELAGEGGDFVMSSASSYTLQYNLETLILSGATAYKGWGNSLDNRIVGNGNANNLYGGGGMTSFKPAAATTTRTAEPATTHLWGWNVRYRQRHPPRG